MTLMATRLIALFALFSLTMLMGIGPVILFRFWARKKKSAMFEVSKGSSVKKSDQSLTKSTASAITLQLFMFFGGGVLLATCFVHLIPEVRENFDHYFHSLENDDTSNHQHSHGSSASQSSPHDHSHGSEHDSPNEHEYDPEHHHHDHDNGNATELESISATASSLSYNDSNATLSPNYDEYDASVSLQSTTGHSHKHKVPYVELAICGGFFLIYLLEEIIHLAIGHNHHDKDDEGEINDDGELTGLDKVPKGTIQTTVECEPLPNNKNANLSVDSPAHLVSCNKLGSAHHYGTIGYDNPAVDLKEDAIYPEFRAAPIEAFADRGNISPTSSSYNMLNKSTNSNRVPLSVRFLRGLVTIVAFSAHSVFDGVAIGLQKTSSQLWTIFFAISMHKLVVAFAIGLELYEQTASFGLTCIHMILFSVMSPIGILIVILTESEFSSQDSPVIILLSAVATGTILYIVFFEILQRDRCSKIPGLVQFLVLVVGFTCMSCLTLFIDH